MRVTSKLIFEIFVRLELAEFGHNRTHRKIHVPEFIWRSPKHVVKEFLSGLFEADGHAAKEKDWIVFASKVPRFAKDVQLLLLGFGITCRVFPTLSKINKNRNDRVYSSYRMELRAEEAVRFHKEIGFLSVRKQTCSTRQAPFRNAKLSAVRRQAIELADEVISVERTGRLETVYNLTVEAPHWFDANGIVTHNTAEQAFVQTGYSFFQTRLIGKDLQKITDANRAGEDTYTFKGYRYHVDGDFFSFSMEKLGVRDMAAVELKVWEEPVPNGRYVLGFDPAYGRNEHKDHHSISIWRCFADKIVQVAEYVTCEVETKHAAWVMFHLMSAYGDVMANVELGGPGMLVMSEFEHLRQLLSAQMNQEKVKAKGWEEAGANARWYLYHRPDSPGPGYVANFKTGFDTKWQIMSGMRGAYVSREIEIRSWFLLKEMEIVVVNDSIIGAPESSSEDCKDDRVFAAAFALRAWQDWVRKEMIMVGQTYEFVMTQENGEIAPTTRNVNNMVMRFLSEANAEPEPEGPPQWMQDRGLA